MANYFNLNIINLHYCVKIPFTIIIIKLRS